MVYQYVGLESKLTSFKKKQTGKDHCTEITMDNWWLESMKILKPMRNLLYLEARAFQKCAKMKKKSRTDKGQFHQ
jgi:hypothetical protein